MLCRKPYSSGAGQLFPCGQCMPCRFNKRREWTHRIMLESYLHGDNSFLTLTYDDDHIPRNADHVGVLRPKDVQDWLKRFRKTLEPTKIRYYLVGEYGDETQRPHYHLALFGYPCCQRGNSRFSRGLCCTVCDRIQSTWPHGQIMLGELSTNSAQYVAGYVTKKMTQKDDPRLNGRPPEFARMSLRPGIGADFVPEIASSLLTFNLDETETDVPVSLRHGSRKLPLGRYLRKKLRKELGRDEKAPQEALDQMAEKLQPLRQIAFDQSRPFRDVVTESTAQKVKQMEARQRIFKIRKTL